MSRQASIPSYRLHKQSGQAIVTLPDGLGGRRDGTLGQYNTPESRAEYCRVLAEWEANCRRVPDRAPVNDLTMNELMRDYLAFVDGYYVKAGQPTSEPDNIRQALRFVKPLYAHTPAAEFGPLALKAVRKAMIQHPITKTRKVKNPETGEITVETRVLRLGLSRRLINKQMDRIRRMFGWAVEEELLPSSVREALSHVKGLRRGRGDARETSRIRPVPEALADAILPHLPQMLQTMVQVQRLTGCRPQELVSMRTVDFDMTGSEWEYRPGRYKTQHHDEGPDRERVIFIGPQAQRLLRPYLVLDMTSPLFCPSRSEEQRNGKRRAQRQSPMTPSQAARQPRGRGKHPFRDHYSVASYRRAVQRAWASGESTWWAWRPCLRVSPQNKVKTPSMSDKPGLQEPGIFRSWYRTCPWPTARMRTSIIV
jgi:integrase